jgi:hypothetical protein
MIDNQKNDRKSAPAPPSRFAALANAANREGGAGGRRLIRSGFQSSLHRREVGGGVEIYDSEEFRKTKLLDENLSGLT